MKLNESQIEYLYRFTRQHYVEYYDLQIELVDHLGNGIESQWEEFPRRSFEEALQIEFKKFGVYGFADVIKKKQNTLTKRYYKLIFQFVKEWFKFPKFCYTLLVFTVFYQMLMQANASRILEVILIVMVTLGLGVFAFNFHRYRRKQLTARKKWLLKDIIFNTGGLVSFASLPLQLFHLIVNKEFIILNYSLTYVIMACILTFLSMAGYIVFVVIPKRSEKLLETTYPEYKFEKSM